MKVKYDQEVDVLTIQFSNAPVEESDEDKPGIIQHVHFLVVFHFHGFLQYLVILLVRYAVTTTGGLTVSLTITRNRYLLAPISTCD